MSLSVKCPTCGKELLAADELVGKLASCPHCQTQFPVTMSATRTVSGTSATATRQPTAAPSVPAGTIPVAKPLNLRTAPSLLQAESDAPGPPSTTPPPPTGASQSALKHAAAPHNAPPQTPPGPRSSPAAHPPASLYPPGQSPRPTSVENTNTTAPAAKVPRRSPSLPSREARPARFIPADVSATRVELGHDGQLPVLQLDEVTQVDAEGQNARESKPWFLAAAVAISVCMSVALFLVDADRAPAERATKQSARSEIEMYYIAPAAQSQLYSQLLAQALQANNKGDYAKERRRYKQVLDLLHAENKDPLRGLTGQVNAPGPPNDRHLEELLSTLVDD